MVVCSPKAFARQLYPLCWNAVVLRESFLHIIVLPLALLWVKPCQHFHDKLLFWKVFNLTIKMCLRLKFVDQGLYWRVSWHISLFFSTPEENSTPRILGHCLHCDSKGLECTKNRDGNFNITIHLGMLFSNGLPSIYYEIFSIVGFFFFFFLSKDF